MTYITFFTRCIQAVCLFQRMQCVQCKHPSDQSYHVVKLIDPIPLKSKHYAVAVDIHDKRTADILMTLLSVLSRMDTITFIGFSDHTIIQTYDMDKLDIYKVEKLYSVRTDGLNTLVAIRTLESISADAYIMITAGCHDKAPSRVVSTFTRGQLHVFSPVRHHYMEHAIALAGDEPKMSPIRSALGIKTPNYYDVKLIGAMSVPICVQSPAYGGCSIVPLLRETNDPIKVTYMTEDGKRHETTCTLEDDDSLPYEATRFMKPCRMVE